MGKGEGGLMNALATLEQFPLTKKEQIQFANLLIDEILLSDDMNSEKAIKVELFLKAFEEVIKTVRKHQDVQNQLFKAIGSIPLEAHGARIEIGKRTSYDYSNCGDTVYNDMIVQQKALNEQIKAREQMLKTGVNPETGEVYTKPKTKVTEHVKITFK